jgi:hypothetical protein
MPVRFKADGNTAKLAIYDVPSVTSTDDTPLTAPRSNLSRVRWHSDFSYIHEKSRFTASVTLPAKAANSFGYEDFTLGAHGVTGGVPVILAIAKGVTYWGGSVDVPLFGTVPILTTIPTIGNQPHAYTTGLWWLTLGATATDVVLRGRYVATSVSALVSRTLSIEVLVTGDVV